MRYRRIRDMIWLLGLSSLVVSAGSMAPAQQDLIPLRVEMLTRAVSKLPFVIALDQGLYKKHGLDVQPWMPPSEFEVGIEVEVKRPEEPDISVDGLTPMMVSIVTNARAKQRIALATTDCAVRWHIIARKGINSLKDLKGKRLGVSGYGAVSDFMARLFALRMGWDPIQDISIMENGMSIDALQEDLVDAIMAHERFYATARQEGFPILADTQSWNEFIGGNSVRVERAWLQNNNNREAARRFLMATVEAIALFHQNRDLALQVLSKWHGIKDEEFAGIVYARGATIPRKPYPCYEGIRKTMELYDSNEMRKYKPEDFYDDSLMRELDESGFIDGLYK